MASRCRFLVWGVMGIVAAVLLAQRPAVRAQTLNEGWKGLEPLYNKHRGTIRDLQSGKIKLESDNKSHLEAIDVLARFYAYGPYLQNLESQPNHKLAKAYQDFAGDVDKVLLGLAKDRETIQPFAEVLRDRLRVRALDVLQFEGARPIHKIYSARVLAKVAELGQGALAETLLTVLQDNKQNAAVHYYVLKGLATLLAQIQPMQTPRLLTTDEESKCAEVVLAFLNGLKAPDKNAPQDEIDGFRWLRREAIHALAQLHTPAYSKTIRPALVLARFAGNDERIQPPPRIDERVEAAIGLARMQASQNKQYHADYAAAQIAKCIGDFGAQYNSEFEAKEKKSRPYRVDAFDLKEALTVLNAESGKDAFVSQVLKRANTVLQDVDRNKKTESGDTNWLSTQSNPSSKELFADAEDSIVKPAGSVAAAPEK